METKIHQTIKKVSNDFEGLKFNTAIAAMMALVNDFYKASTTSSGLTTFPLDLDIFSPFSPRIMPCEVRFM